MIVTTALVVAGLALLLVVGPMFGLMVMNGGGGPLMYGSFALGIVLLGLAVIRRRHRS